jgi:hypothetical protein
MKQMIAVATVAAAFAIATSSVSAQTATTTDATTTDATTSATPTASSTVKTESTPQMVSEALQRSQKRHEKFLANGTPEQWGSEEPFVYDPTKFVQ